MSDWVRFTHQALEGFGTLHGDLIAVHTGDMFGTPAPSGQQIPLDQVQLLPPCHPSKMICLWNNFHQLAERNKFPVPEVPLYFIKTSNAYHPHGQPVLRPQGYAGRIVYEGELGIVIGKPCANIDESQAADYIFGYTCVNDITAVDLLKENPSFDQWTRAKSFDTFGPFGPAIATGVDPMQLRVQTFINGQEKQNYPVDDMFFPPHKLVAMLSQYMTLMPGDLISCGTSLGAGPMPDASNHMEIVIEGVGRLSNRFDQLLPSPYLLKKAPAPMRVCVVGAGAIGGLLAAKLALAGHAVTVVDQGAHLKAIRRDGLTLQWHDGRVDVVPVTACASVTEAGKQDLVILALKAHFLDRVAADLDTVLEPDTMVMTVQNGLPWWYFQKLGGEYEGHRLRSLDPPGSADRKNRQRADSGLRGLPGGQRAATRCRRPCRGRPLPAGRTRRQHQRTRPVHARCAGPRRAEVAGAQRHPFGDLAESLGQFVLQPHQRPLPRHAGRNLPVPRDPATRRHHDGRGPKHCQEVGGDVPRQHRQTHRRGAGGRRAQNLDAAGRGGWALAGNRGLDRLGAGNVPPDPHPGTGHRGGVRLG